MARQTLQKALEDIPLIAILRGVIPENVLDVATVLSSAGIKIIEIPQNSPDAFTSIEILQKNLGSDIIIGGGTVTTISQVNKISSIGGRLIVSPNTNIEVIKQTKKLGLISVPGFYTPSEAFSAIESGADALKLFPAETLGVAGLKAIKVVLPTEVPIYPVGGVNADNMNDFIVAGASGFGIGSSIYGIGDTVDQVRNKADKFIKSIQNNKK